MFAFQPPWYPDGAPWQVNTFGVCGMVFLIVTLVFACLSWRNKRLSPCLYVFLAIWGLVPPLWFWYEYFFLILPRGTLADDVLEKYKHGVQLGAAIWAAVAVGLAGYIKSDRFKDTVPLQGDRYSQSEADGITDLLAQIERIVTRIRNHVTERRP